MENTVDSQLALVVSSITNLATTVQTNGLTVLANVLPVVGTLMAAIIVANVGRRVVVRFAR